jgi:hypothetical protein
MPLNREGIEQLKADLRANAKHYSQNSFGRIKPECGTEACMAGMCLIRKIGMDAFTQRTKEAMIDDRDGQFTKFVNECLNAAADQIGLTVLDEQAYMDAAHAHDRHSDGLPPVFSSADLWPTELADKYGDASDAHDHEAMANIACQVLDRIDENGFIF